MNKINRVGVDIGKNCFHVCAVTEKGNVVWRKQYKRAQFPHVLINELESDVTVGMEACGGAHHWARLFQAQDFRVLLIAPQFVKPYVTGNKNDNIDAEAIAEAMSRPKLHSIPIKSIEQQSIQSMHRVRDELIKQRTAKVNQIRGLCAEMGLVTSPTIAHLRRAVPCWLEDADNSLDTLFRALLADLYHDLKHLENRVDELNAQVKKVLAQSQEAQRLSQLRGVGPLLSTALVAALGDAKAYRRGRDFAASLGLTPRQHSTGGKERLLGISKRGDSYLRKQLIHGARSAIYHARNKDDALSRWINDMLKRKHPNVVTVALAAKTARMAWAMTNQGLDYNPARAAG